MKRLIPYLLSISLGVLCFFSRLGTGVDFYVCVIDFLTVFSISVLSFYAFGLLFSLGTFDYSLFLVARIIGNFSGGLYEYKQSIKRTFPHVSLLIVGLPTLAFSLLLAFLGVK